MIKLALDIELLLLTEKRYSEYNEFSLRVINLETSPLLGQFIVNEWDHYFNK